MDAAHRGATALAEGTGGAPGADAMHRAAGHGVSGSGGVLPHRDAIQRSFGRHDISHVSAHVGGVASEATHAHVVQQRGGVHLKDGVGQSGDAYERHADAVADRVIA